ncbi:rRNA maturation RNase YbeY [Lutimonas sp.]|uniref:rRNA maturation RNase YbeY n=1 Tax=Lutimonas sp. TaxID=1872403 RepID=UPI003D9AEA9A
MIEYTSIGDFVLEEQKNISEWVGFTLDQEKRELGELNYIFCDDSYLLDLNINSLNHSTLTDIISFDYTLGNIVFGDIYISYERVRENAKELQQDFRDELHRVMIHGVLHYCGYKDKMEDEKKLMREKEDYYLSLRTF